MINSYCYCDILLLCYYIFKSITTRVMTTHLGKVITHFAVHSYAIKHVQIAKIPSIGIALWVAACKTPSTFLAGQSLLMVEFLLHDIL